MEKIYILNIFLILTIVLIVSLFTSYFFKISRIATNLENNLSYGCKTKLDIPEPVYSTSFSVEEREKFYKQFILHGVNLLYYYAKNNDDLVINDDTTVLKKLIYDKHDKMFGMFVYHKTAKVNFLIYRGTLTQSDWSDIDIDIKQSDYVNCENGCVHSGFYKRFNELKDQLVNIFSVYDNKKLYIGGHSLGAPICIFTSLLIKNKYKDINYETYVFALPKMGNQNFAKYVNTNMHNKLKIYDNQADIIPNLPFTSTLNTDNKNRPYIYYNFKRDFYYYFYCARKFVCSNHGLKVYYDNIDRSKQMTDIEYCNEEICNY